MPFCLVRKGTHCITFLVTVVIPMFGRLNILHFLLTPLVIPATDLSEQVCGWCVCVWYVCGWCVWYVWYVCRWCVGGMCVGGV